MIALFYTIENKSEFDKLKLAYNENNTKYVLGDATWNATITFYYTRYEGKPDIPWGSIVFIRETGTIYFNLLMYGKSIPTKYSILCGVFCPENNYSSWLTDGYTIITDNLPKKKEYSDYMLFHTAYTSYKNYDYTVLLKNKHLFTYEWPDGSESLSPLVYTGISSKGELILCQCYDTFIICYNFAKIDARYGYIQNILPKTSDSSPIALLDVLLIKPITYITITQLSVYLYHRLNVEPMSYVINPIDEFIIQELHFIYPYHTINANSKGISFDVENALGCDLYFTFYSGNTSYENVRMLVIHPEHNGDFHITIAYKFTDGGAKFICYVIGLFNCTLTDSFY